MTSDIRLIIDLGAIAANWRDLARLVAPAACAAVVKADAYGLGIGQVAPALWQAGCRSFFVAHLSEGIGLREVLPGAEIFVLNGIPPGEEDAGFAAGLTPVVNGLEDLARLKMASSGRCELPIALHIDTGINRLGLNHEELVRLRAEPELLARVRVVLAMSHLVISEAPAHPLNRRQQERFARALPSLPAAHASLANSSGIFLGPAFHFELVRPGAALYGVNPLPGRANPMRSVVTLKARVLKLQDVAPGETVGYGADFLVTRPSRIATLSIGYADGLPRRLGNRGHVFAAGTMLPIVGRVSMDTMTVDATELPGGMLAAGAFVEVIGPHVAVDRIAADADTIGYEILTGLGSRAARVYVNGSEPAEARL